MSDVERPSEYHRRLPYGERVAADPVLGGPFFPFEGDLQVVPLAEPVLPEPPRAGEPGSEHFHVWFLARPLGMMQLRGAMIATWADLLPQVPDAEFLTNARTVATALAETSGTPLGKGV